MPYSHYQQWRIRKGILLARSKIEAFYRKRGFFPFRCAHCGNRIRLNEQLQTGHKAYGLGIYHDQC